ncbi:MAG: hypothetical protein IPK60_08790 [Sandaracinaceae bacterium]|nr:hypothetical protein [Sandaracinaceae bacterium]
MNVFPSGMSRSMGHGTMAYRLTLGLPALRAHLTSIFEASPELVPATVDAF